VAALDALSGASAGLVSNQAKGAISGAFRCERGQVWKMVPALEPPAEHGPCVATRLVVGHVCLPALLVGWEPAGVAISPSRKLPDALSTHKPSLRP
jgi:hypothetical protein